MCVSVSLCLRVSVSLCLCVSMSLCVSLSVSVSESVPVPVSVWEEVRGRFFFQHRCLKNKARVRKRNSGILDFSALLMIGIGNLDLKFLYLGNGS